MRAARAGWRIVRGSRGGRGRAGPWLGRSRRSTAAGGRSRARSPWSATATGRRASRCWAAAAGRSSSTRGRARRGRRPTGPRRCATASGDTCTCPAARSTRRLRRAAATSRRRRSTRRPTPRTATTPRSSAGRSWPIERVFGDRAVLARCGLILGPYEDVGRLPWWLLRMDRGGEVLAPGPPDLALQYVDVRDLARFLLDAGAEGRSAAVQRRQPSWPHDDGRAAGGLPRRDRRRRPADVGRRRPGDRRRHRGVDRAARLAAARPRVPRDARGRRRPRARRRPALPAGGRDRGRYLGVAAVARQAAAPAPRRPAAGPRPGDGGGDAGGLARPRDCTPQGQSLRRNCDAVAVP